ncbi:MAG: efflux RND transporter periplasmic adaptor subunit [Candidatus Margulisiibacteriota bacterium]
MKKFGFILLLVLSVMVFSCGKNKDQELKKATVQKGSIKTAITTVGEVVPRNRLEIKPPIGGRVEQVLVKEGNNVAKGQTIAWMSSSDRATLIDAARAKGEEELKYWEDAYKPAPVIAPLSGFIIKRSVEPGQSVTISDAIIVMADKLIVKAQVDETDIGKISDGQKVILTLDAYPNKEINGTVEHIAYESETINNVNIYVVDVIPSQVPSFFKSGMSASAKFILSDNANALLLPSEAIKKYKGSSYVLSENKDEKISAVQVETGTDDGTNTEILSGLSEGDTVILPDAKLSKQYFSSVRGGPPNLFGGSKK